MEHSGPPRKDIMARATWSDVDGVRKLCDCETVEIGRWLLIKCGEMSYREAFGI